MIITLVMRLKTAVLYRKLVGLMQDPGVLGSHALCMGTHWKTETRSAEVYTPPIKMMVAQMAVRVRSIKRPVDAAHIFR